MPSLQPYSQPHATSRLTVTVCGSTSPSSHSYPWASVPPALASAAEEARYACPRSSAPFRALDTDSPCSLSQNPETSRLLYDDPYRTQYGTNGQANQRQSYQPDPETQRREREALEGLCHAMSEYDHIYSSFHCSVILGVQID